MADNQRRRLVLENGSDARDPASVPYLPGNPVLRTGMQLRNVEGIVRVDAQGHPRLQVEGALKLPELKRPAVPTVPGSLHVAPSTWRTSSMVTARAVASRPCAARAPWTSTRRSSPSWSPRSTPWAPMSLR